MSSRQCRRVLFLLAGLFSFLSIPSLAAAQNAPPPPASAQPSAGGSTAIGATQGSAPQTIDILAPPPPGQELDYRECTAQEMAAKISGEIVVCRVRQDQSGDEYSSRESAMDRYAAATAFRDAPATPDPCGPNCGIFSGPATVSNLCIPGLAKCPPPPALFIDVSALPKAPPGSDADRIAHGLPPLGHDDDSRLRRVLSEQNRQALDLPAPTATPAAGKPAQAPPKTAASGAATQADKAPVSPAGSAGPAAQP